MLNVFHVPFGLFYPAFREIDLEPEAEGECARGRLAAEADNGIPFKQGFQPYVLCYKVGDAGAEADAETIGRCTYMRVGALYPDIAFEEEPAASHDLGVLVADIITCEGSDAVANRTAGTLSRDHLKIYIATQRDIILNEPGSLRIEREREIVSRIQTQGDLRNVTAYHDITFLDLGVCR